MRRMRCVRGQGRRPLGEGNRENRGKPRLGINLVLLCDLYNSVCEIDWLGLHGDFRLLIALRRSRNAEC